MIVRTLSPRFVQTELARLGVTEWPFIRECSRADRCSVNRCPLDPLIELRSVDPLDREKRCTVSKPDRERFFSRLSPEMQALLPFGGLYESEFRRREAARRRFASLSDQQRADLVAQGTAALEKARLSLGTKPTDLSSTPDTSKADSAPKARATGGEAA